MLTPQRLSANYPEHAFKSLGITLGHFTCLFPFNKSRISNIEYPISIPNIEFQISQRFRVDVNMLENATRVDTDLFNTQIEKMRLKTIRIRVDMALLSLA